MISFGALCCVLMRGAQVIVGDQVHGLKDIHAVAVVDETAVPNGIVLLETGESERARERES